MAVGNGNRKRDLYIYANNLPKEELYGLTKSNAEEPLCLIPANIAEGHATRFNKRIYYDHVSYSTRFVGRTGNPSCY